MEGDATGDLWEGIDSTSFDLIHSNSVVEHVGDWTKMQNFADNIKKFEGAYFVQTPNYWFPIEPHCMTPFFHWLPKPMRVSLVKNFALGHWKKAGSVSEAVSKVERIRLLDKKMFSSLFDDADIKSEKVLLLNKSFLAIRPA
jgi:2-polyprenyl-3-methyl-5-hydroxy-6-metoxy-1,4-benzoquinol methylase